MKTIIKMQFGSHLYGTNTPASDKDYKGVFVPDMRDVLLGKQPSTSITQSTGQSHAKNSSDDVDTEMFTLHGYLKMVAKGEVVALDMLFAPESNFVSDPATFLAWKNVQDVCKKYLLSKQTTAYIGYCRKQAAKYGIKGGRVNDVRVLLDLLKTFDKNAKLYEFNEQLVKHCSDKEFTTIIEGSEQRNIGGGGTKNPWANKLIECCNRKAPLTNTVKSTIEVYQKVFDGYGARALQAETNDNVDWKAMHHAMRACEEAIELLDTGHITFPLKRADYHKEIKQGKHEYKVIAVELEELMAEVERAAVRSKLPDHPDMEALEDFVAGIYGTYVAVDAKNIVAPDFVERFMSITKVE